MMTEYEMPKDWRPTERDQVRACFCIGPQNGEAECPCRMRAKSGISLTYDDLVRLLEKRK